MKFFIRIGMSVKGIQTSASKMSLTARLMRKALVTVAIIRFLVNTTSTMELPRTDRLKIRAYSGMLTLRVRLMPDGTRPNIPNVPKVSIPVPVVFEL